MPLPWKKPEEKRAFYESYRDVYKAMKFTDEEIDKIIDSKVNNESEAEKKFAAASDANEKYTKYLSNASKYSSFVAMEASSGLMTRVIRGMVKPETSIENIEYNELLAKRLQSRDGIVSVLQEAVTMIATADPNIFLTTENDPGKVVETFNIRAEGHIANSLGITINEYKKSLGITEEEIPQVVIDNLRKDEGLYHMGETDYETIKRESSIFNLIIPSIDELAPIDLNADEKTIAEQKEARLNLQYRMITGVHRMKTRDNEFTNDLITYMGAFNAKGLQSEKKDGKFTERTDVEKAFFDKTLARMKEESKDYKAVAEKVSEQIVDKNAYLFEKNWIVSGAFQGSLKKISEDKDGSYQKTVAENVKLCNKNLEKIKPLIIETVNKPIKDCVEDLYKAVKGGSIVGVHNPNYEEMLESVKKMRKAVKSGQLTGKNREEFKKALRNLADKSNAYLHKKHEDDKLYSERALNRISVATMCLSAYNAINGKLSFEENITLKENLKLEINPEKEYNFRDAKTVFEKCNELFTIDPNPKNFARVLTAQTVFNQLNLDKDMTMTGENIAEMMDANIQIYQKLCEQDVRFVDAIREGDFEKTMKAVNEINRDMSTRMYADRLYRNELGMDSYKIEATGNNEINTPRSVKAEEEPKVQKAPNVPNVPQ